MTRVQWRCRGHEWTIVERPLVMGILNVTPDSFSDGGRHLDPELAIRRGVQMVAEGADIIDVGGESTRPGAEPVSEAVEIERVVPVIEQLCREADVLLSVDTMKAGVARRALEVGASIINDVSAFTGDPAMVEMAAESGAGAILMHMYGTPRTMQNDPVYGDVVRDIRDYLADRVEDAVARGVCREAIAVDPGIGFGKTVEHNLRLLAGIDKIAQIGRPVMIGLSRKSFLGKLTGCPVEDRLAGSLAAMAFATLRGTHIVRVHDVKETKEAVTVLAALNKVANEQSA